MDREWCALSRDAAVWKCCLPSGSEKHRGLAKHESEQLWEFYARICSKAQLVVARKYLHCTALGAFQQVPGSLYPLHMYHELSALQGYSLDLFNLKSAVVSVLVPRGVLVELAMLTLDDSCGANDTPDFHAVGAWFSRQTLMAGKFLSKKASNGFATKEAWK